MKCTKCLIDKPIDEFSWKIKAKGIRHKRCKKCVSLSVGKHYIASKDKYKRKAVLNNRRYYERNRLFVSNFLIGKKCVDCGIDNPIVLDFDHVRGKKLFSIGYLKKWSYSIAVIEKEIEKCEIRCANCHRIRTHDERLKKKHGSKVDTGFSHHGL